MPTLFVVATPIGNLGDLSPRAVETLRAVGLIAAEDTRVTQRLLAAFDIHTPLTSCHEHNERVKAEQIVRRMLDEGIDVAVTTDAGTPCISDPGSLLTAEAIRCGLPVVAVPGPTAMASALCVSGLPIEEFTFYGFLPRQKSDLQAKLLDMAAKSKIAVVHESPHRVIDLLESVRAVLPHTYLSASCDLTKKFEATVRGDVDEVLQTLQANPKAEKGEYCIVMEWRDAVAVPAPACELSLEARLFDALVGGQTLRQATDALTEAGERKNAVKAAALRVKAMLAESDTES
ncbi:MAG TPA: 16S rRNA (cytidine(1402)-2'-O)-methyltransferase [Candidatus Limiplasma sp.]|nr:16S rRNA (cytidine(1402)-2'-O)-methyltransferase [Candidatus Limiplasma sp.]HPS81718.1 16S rRNA (cytidine(1402)-2'-O)-methyltransferase [Candidatus Limiplasma sp.]